MATVNLRTYLPQDRLRALARGESLPDRTTGSALFADISGFTPLTEGLRKSLGQRRGSEELTTHLDAVYTALIHEVEKYDGNVIGFAGDAITCWFDDSNSPASPRATTCAFALQRAMRAFAAMALPGGATTALALKVAVATGPARRFVVGDPALHYLDALAGATVARTSMAEHLAQKGEVLLDEATVNILGSSLSIREWRTDVEHSERFAVVTPFEGDVIAPIVPPPAPVLESVTLQAWVHRTVYECEVSGQGTFLTEFRPCVALFVRFIGIDYDTAEAETRLDTFIRHAQKIIARYDGTLLQITIGDKGSYIYITFGALSAHEDDARRAVKAAFDLKKAADTLGFLAPLQSGITQGTLRVGAYGGKTRRTYGALGDDVNLAARLMQTAAPGEILLSGSVQKVVAAQFVFEPRSPLPMKGKAEPLPVFAVTGERQHRAIRLQEPTYALPMVGRQKELQMTNDKLDLTLSGKSQIIGIVAEAGLGKSRLVAEVIRAARKKGFAGYGGACQSDAINTPYQAWKSIWSAFFDVDPSAPLRKQIRSLEGEIEDRAPDRVEALPLLGILLNLEIPENDFTKPLESKYRQSALHALLEDCLRAAAKDEPLLIVIEDLHWIDALSHDLLEELARALIDSPVCFVLAYRPPALARLVAPRLEALPNFTKIALSELNATEAEQAVRAKLAQLYPARGGAVPPVLLGKLMARAQGNPFFLEELLNFLHDRSLDPRDPNVLDKIELPDSLHTLILSRIDQLSEREKTTLRVASIVGRLFRAAWLTGYYPELGELPKVKADLDQLAKMDITPLDTPEPELAYLFKHIVTHEVTYESLPFATRARLHEQLAQYLEGQIAVGALHTTPLLDTLVYHYTRSENRTKQRAYLQKAGQAALGVSAFNTAVEYLTGLVELTPAADPARAALALQLAEAHYRLGDQAAARVTIQQAQAAATTEADRAAALALLGEITSELGDYAQAQTILAEALPLARASGDALTLCRALYALGDVGWRLGKLDDAHAPLNESLSLARSLGDVTRELFALNRLGGVILQQGDLVEAERLIKEVHTRAAAVGNRERAMVALNGLGVVAGARQNVAAARDYFQQALALARELGAQQNIAMFLINLADTDIKLGCLAAARAGLREGLALALRLGALTWAVVAVMYFAKLTYAEGQTEEALAFWGLARVHPAWASDDQQELDAALARWALDVAVVEAGLAKGAALDWDTTIQELLKG
jgi:adenylate cyclase